MPQLSSNAWAGLSLATIGHSTRSLEEFMAILTAQAVDHIADVRSFPYSRRFPWFNHDNLASGLRTHQIGYTHLLELGGRRSKKQISGEKGMPSQAEIEADFSGWREPSFRNYAAYTQSAAFNEGLNKLHTLVEKNKYVALLCAEAVPWRCHRRLIADALTARGAIVYDILNAQRADVHALPDFARLKGDGTVLYPAPQPPIGGASATAAPNRSEVRE